MIQFYAPDIETTLSLPESESGHCIRVLRMHAGDTIPVVDGRGTRFTCRLLDEHPKHASVEIISSESVPKVWQGNITIMVAPTKSGDRMEWLVEKLTEIGVDRIVPIKCEHSERRDIKRERLEKIVVSAMKQSLKAVLPEVTDMMPLDKAIKAFDAPGKFVGYCDDTCERSLLARNITPGQDTIILIGPEGDFSPAEIAMVMEAGYKPVTMGDNRLRTETAALVGCDTFHIVGQMA